RARHRQGRPSVRRQRRRRGALRGRYAAYRQGCNPFSRGHGPTTIAFAPDGTMAWTDLATGDLYARKGDGPIRKLASGLPGINRSPSARTAGSMPPPFSSATRSARSTSRARKPPRQIMEKMGGLNGFEFGPDDKLYGPLWFKGQAAQSTSTRPSLTGRRRRLQGPGRGELRSQGQSLRGRYRARRS
ncbi:hypothetical protein ACU4GH_29010, partial [Bradyrhizobium betae]